MVFLFFQNHIIFYENQIDKFKKLQKIQRTKN